MHAELSRSCCYLCTVQIPFELSCHHVVIERVNSSIAGWLFCYIFHRMCGFSLSFHSSPERWEQLTNRKQRGCEYARQEMKSHRLCVGLHLHCLMTEIRREENTAGSSSFPIMCFLDVCVLLAREDVDSSSAPIRIKASSIGGQRHALWVEIALPLLRKNIEKPPHWPNQTFNVDKCQ